MRSIIVVAALALSGLPLGTVLAQDPLEPEGASTNALAPAGPVELRLTRARSAVFDLRNLPQTAPVRRERPEHEGPEIENRIALPGAPPAPAPLAPLTIAAAPPPLANFAGLDFATWGAGHPPDTNGDVGPVHFIQSINSSVGIYRKSDGAQIAAFTLDTFMSQGNFGNLCDTDNFGDPVVLYDTFEDRWVITDFAFQLDGGGNVVNPPGAFECIAVSKTGDPVSGGWNFYSINTAGGLGDYPKFGIWTDGIYMSVNMFAYASGGAFLGPRVYAFNKAQMYAGEANVQVVTFEAPAGDFTLLPSNARLQTGTPPAGTPNYFISTWQFLNAVTVYKFHVDWDRVTNSTFTGPDTPLASTSWPNANVANAPSQGGNSLDVLPIRAMMQNQYSNIGGVESLWTSHTVRRANTTGFAAPRWYQVDVSGGAVAPNMPQAATWDPDAANVMHRFMPSVAVNRVGDLAIGYSTSSSSTKPAIKYAGRLAGDPVNTFSQTEQVLIQGTGTQTGSCGGTCARWGDYSTMTLDPDGCTFWYTNQYYATDGLNHQTRIGSFAYPGCTASGTGTLQGTVTASVGGAPIDGVTVMLGSRTATTNASGVFAFAGLPAGTYPTISASKAGYVTAAAASIVVNDSATTTQDFVLSAAPANACLTDTTQADFLTGVPVNLDLTSIPGSVTLDNNPPIDQQNTSLGTNGVGITTTTWGGQTFTPALSGQLVKVDINLFCSGCTGTTPDLTLSLRATSGGLPSGADLGSATINGFNSGASAYYTATFAVPPAIVAGTRYALVIRPTANPSPGIYALTRSGTSTVGANTYADGARVAGSSSGTVWSAPLTGGIGTDAGFATYMNVGYAANGNLVSSNKDSNLAVGQTPLWSTLSWTATTPASTDLRFQVAASDASTGPFNFVGPDGSAGTFYTSSGGSLAQFNGKRYIKYRADLSTGNNALTPTLDDVTACYSTLAPADVAISKTDGVASAVPGASVTYTITASNGSPAAATGVSVVDTFPAALTCSWTCAGSGGGSCTAAGSGNINDVIDLPSGASSVYTANCAISAAATGTLANTATITSVDDPDTANNSATDTDTLNASADLAISKTDGVTTATPGESVTYTITASNTGPSNASGATVADTFPAALTCTWTCVGAGGGSCTAAGSGNINDVVNLASGGSVTYTANCAISASATGTLANTATVSAPGGVTDPTPANNSATDSDTLNASADLSISKTDGVTTATPGGSVTYTITAGNTGPSNATGATVADTFPAALTCTWTCVGAGGGSCTAAGSGNLNDVVNLASGGSVTYTANCAISAAATGTLANTATVSAPGGVTDPTPGNNSATDTDTLNVSADLAISKTDGVTTATPGESVTYTITASNIGPSNATGATVADTFPAALTCTWTCVGAGGGSCTAAGSGNLNDVVNLASGGSVTYTANCAISAAATGTLANTATVSAPGGVTDPTPGNNSATDSDTLSASADVAVTISDSRNYVQVGDSLDYLIEVSNPSGPSLAVASVSDILPVLLGGGSWTCTGSGGASCGSPNGTGNTLSDTATLPVGGKTSYLYSATVQAVDPSEQVANTASASVTNASDPVSGNDSATDTNIVVLYRDGFDPGSAGIVQLLGSGSDYVAARLRIDANLLDALGMVPVDVASGRSSENRVLFSLQLARFNDDYFVRVVTRDDLDQAERSRWQGLDLSERLLSFAWQAASAQASDGYFNVDGFDGGLLVSAHSDHGRLTQLLIRVDDNTPWLVLIDH